MKPIAAYAAPNRPAHAVRILGNRAVTMALDWSVDPMCHALCVWDLQAGTSKVTTFPQDQYPAVQLGPDLMTLIASRVDKSAIELDLASGKVIRELPWPGAGVLAPGAMASVQEVDDGIALFDVAGPRWTHADPAYTRWKTIVWATPELIVVGSQHPKKTLGIHDARDGSLIVRNPIADISENTWLAPGGVRLIHLTSTLKAATLVDVATGATLKRPLLKKGPTTFAFSPDGTVLAAASPDGKVTLFGHDLTKQVGAFASGMASPQLAWTPDGRALIVVDGETGALGSWDASPLGVGASPSLTLAALLPAAKPAKPSPAAKPAKPKVEKRGSLRIARPASTLATHRASIEQVLGKPLPRDVAAFYEQSDGMTHGTDTLCGLAALFDDFRPHRQFRTATAYEQAAEDGALEALPFWGDTWSEDFELGERGALQSLNALARSKQLVRIAGASDALVIDFAPVAPKTGKAPPYQLALAHRGHAFYPLDLKFAAFVEMFEKFGATSWYLAYLSPAAIKAWNIDPVPTVEADLAGFAKAFPAEVAAVIKRAKKLAP